VCYLFARLEIVNAQIAVRLPKRNPGAVTRDRGDWGVGHSEPVRIVF
jgi:hypothetical protein